ncbi:MAG: diaminopimelate decarboxylase, partial [Kiritimatiellia bacterium]
MTARSRALTELGHTDGPLMLGGCSAESLAERFGTPLFVYDAEVIRRRVRAVRQALGSRVQLLYSVKANPNVSVCQVLRSQGCGAEVASAGEILVAVAAGFAGNDLTLAGPAKSDVDLALGDEHGVGLISVESEAELDVLLAGDGPPLCLRVNLP